MATYIHSNFQCVLCAWLPVFMTIYYLLSCRVHRKTNLLHRVTDFTAKSGLILYFYFNASQKGTSAECLMKNINKYQIYCQMLVQPFLRGFLKYIFWWKNKDTFLENLHSCQIRSRFQMERNLEALNINLDACWYSQKLGVCGYNSFAYKELLEIFLFQLQKSS